MQSPGVSILGRAAPSGASIFPGCPGRSVPVDAKGTNGDPFGEENTSFQPPRRFQACRWRLCRGAAGPGPSRGLSEAKLAFSGSRTAGHEKELLQQKGKDQLASLTQSWPLNDRPRQVSAKDNMGWHGKGEWAFHFLGPAAVPHGCRSSSPVPAATTARSPADICWWDLGQLYESCTIRIVGNYFWRSSSPTALQRQGHLKKVTEECIHVDLEFLPRERLLWPLWAACSKYSSSLNVKNMRKNYSRIPPSLLSHLPGEYISQP